MTQSIEIEFKNELTKVEYEKLKDHFRLDYSQFFLQTNHYFDTVRFSLKEKGSALRIRQKANSYELTLKQPYQDGLLETNQVLTEAEAKEAIENNQIPGGHVSELISEMQIDVNQIQFFGTLTTKRAEWEYEKGLLVLDYSTYLNTDDYELEYEVNDREKGQVVFHTLLNSLQIPIRKTDNKIKRFYLRKYKLLSSDEMDKDR
ncbi:CYTH domain-containing protein [Neobacillus sp. D3-1R]|uniref:CYTH domain-containing protein n=1 Tax=Neobacillus sp. D3-1R TaxID=3445778 RepID=UPI003FA14585